MERPYEKRASETEDRDQGPRAGTNNHVPVLKYSKPRGSLMDSCPYRQESKGQASWGREPFPQLSAKTVVESR
ncbi:hypothetical protein BGZ46_007962 [Entomortierella lignicola]|nr:hypothetical protein BGZ46_007962 [Entomortierella lignicola]